MLRISLCLLYLTSVQGASNRCVESKASSCGDCITFPECAWCADPNYASNPNVVISRCDLEENLRAGSCAEGGIINPPSVQENTKDEPHSNVGESDVGKATQIRPQEIFIHARPGENLTVKLVFKQAEDYPVDLYYLLDLSKSMENDLIKLRALGKELGTSMQEITRDFRLGFGSFIDKTVMPYISTVPAKIDNPCSAKSPCVPAYSFRNDLPLTEVIDEFVSSVGNVTHSSNLDNPEGGLDAMMQSIVCQKEINWRRDATHLLVFSTDAGFHYAGDGKLGGIVFPNDGKCYLDSSGSYTMADKMDYPSIGHLVKKISEYNIQPIFAVTSSVIETYQNFAKMIPKSVVGELSGDSSNIIGLIQKAYNDLKGKVILELNEPEGVKVWDKMAECGNVTLPGLQCEGVKLGGQVNFTFKIQVDAVDQCLTEPLRLVVSPAGYSEEAVINIMPQCDCECQKSAAPNNCSGHGTYECGACVCDRGFTGLDCSCNQNEAVGIESYLDNCTDPSTGLVCTERGECQCGRCLCTQYKDRMIDGRFCECDNTTCSRAEGHICNNHGRCDCGVCTCDEGWNGTACDCTLDESVCYEPTFDQSKVGVSPCNGHGECECGVCKCKDTGEGVYRGEFCEIPPIVVCDSHRDCIQCKAWQSGAYNETECAARCSNYEVSFLAKDEGSAYEQECRFTDLTDDCTFQAYYKKDGNTIYVDVEEEKICQTFVDPMMLIFGIIVAVVTVGIAILLIWKVYTSMKDQREYKKFLQESQNVKFQGGENPIYKKATSTFQNPTFTAGKPTSNL